jgi:hypothetical protein
LRLFEQVLILLERPAEAGPAVLVIEDMHWADQSIRDLLACLIRQAVHDELLPGERGQVHSRSAEAIAADPALVMPGRAAFERAWHWYTPHDTTRTLTSAWQAAGQAGRALAYGEQLAMLSRVLDLWPQVPDAAQGIGVRSRRHA